MKIYGRAIRHKTERGPVPRRLADEASIERAARNLLAPARPEAGAVGVLVSRLGPLEAVDALIEVRDA